MSEYDSTIKGKLPCGCDLCQHFIDYFYSFKFSRNFICKCSKEYNSKYMLRLGILLFSINDKIAGNIIYYFNKILNKICCMNNETFKDNDNKINIKKVKSSDFNNLYPNEEILNNFLSNLHHKICEKCQKEGLSKFHCLICDISHNISD